MRISSVIKNSFLAKLAFLLLVPATGILGQVTASDARPKPTAEQPSTPQSWKPPQGTWQPVPSQRKDFGKIKVVWLQGSPYQMGFQHGQLLKKEIATLGPEILDALRFAGRGFGLKRLAMRRSFPEVVQECEGLTDATKDIGMTMDACMVLALGDVYQAYFTKLLPSVLFNDGCSHFVASGKATSDGGFYNGWTLDNNKSPIKYWVENPTILVRQPNNGIPHVFISIPGVVWPNAGFNAEGIVVSNNTSHPQKFEDVSLRGRSVVQLMGQIAKHAKTFDQAHDILKSSDRMRSFLVMVADGKSERAGVFELLGKDMGVRELSPEGVLYMTNHFASPDMEGRDVQNASSLNRFKNFQQLLEPNGSRSRYGKISPQTMVDILRDRTHPDTAQVSPLSLFDDNASIGGNGSLRQVVFDSKRLLFWVANGDVPIPQNEFTCFSLGELLGLPSAQACPSPAIK